MRYDAVNAMLLNGFPKARRQIDAQQKQIEALTAALQEVNTQLEASNLLRRQFSTINETAETARPPLFEIAGVLVRLGPPCKEPMNSS